MTMDELEQDDFDMSMNEWERNNPMPGDSVPDIGDLIPENNNRGTRRINSGNMEVDAGDEGPETAALRAGGGGPGGPVSKETPVSIYPSLSYGLQETHTTILPWRGYFSTVGMTHTAANVIELRLTQPHDCMGTTLDTVAEGASWTKGNFNVPHNNSNTRDSATAATFPATLASGASVLEAASWWEFWRKQYEYYTVLGCKYEDRDWESCCCCAVSCIAIVV